MNGAPPEHERGFMQCQAETKQLIDEWLAELGFETDWSRSINPAGNVLHIGPAGLKLLITDSAIEDNSPHAILGSLAKEHIERFDVHKSWILKSDLRIFPM